MTVTSDSEPPSAGTLTQGDLAIVLAGGAGRRLGGMDKPSLGAPGDTLLDRALAAVRPARTVVVGPPRSVPTGVLQTREDPPGSGPAAGIAAALAAVSTGSERFIALLAADLPAITAAVLRELAGSLMESEHDGAMLVDASGRRQQLISVWRAAALRRAVDRETVWSDRGVRDLLRSLSVTLVTDVSGAAADIDLPEDLERWRPSR